MLVEDCVLSDSLLLPREGILKTAKALVEDTKVLVQNATASQEKLAQAAQSSVSTITRLAEVVKLGAASLGSEDPETQVGWGVWGEWRLLIVCLKWLRVAGVVWCSGLDPVCHGEGWLGFGWWWLSWTPSVPWGAQISHCWTTSPQPECDRSQAIALVLLSPGGPDQCCEGCGQGTWRPDWCHQGSCWKSWG